MSWSWLFAGSQREPFELCQPSPKGLQATASGDWWWCNDIGDWLRWYWWLVMMLWYMITVIGNWWWWYSIILVMMISTFDLFLFTRSRRQVAPRRPVVKAPCCKTSAMQWDNNSESLLQWMYQSSVKAVNKHDQNETWRHVMKLCSWSNARDSYWSHIFVLIWDKLVCLFDNF